MLKEIRRATDYLRDKHGYAFWMLEDVSGLHKNSLLRLSDLEWQPKPATLRALAKLVERAQAHRRGEQFNFPDRRGPGRPKGSRDRRSWPGCDETFEVVAPTEVKPIKPSRVRRQVDKVVEIPRPQRRRAAAPEQLVAAE